MPERPADDRAPRRRIGLLLAVAAAAITVDVVTKAIVVAELSPVRSTRILGGLVYFSLVRNSGAAFGMASGMTIVFAVIALAVVVVIARMARRIRSALWAVSLGLIAGGAIGNLIDRVFRSPGFLRGHVVDFISLFGPDGERYPVFNVADSAITVGVVLLVIATLLGVGLDGSRSRQR